MDVVLFDDAPAIDRATMVECVATYAKRRYASDADEDELERWAEGAFADVWGNGVRVSTFVPVLALRKVREQVLTAMAALPASDSGADRAEVSEDGRSTAVSLRQDRRSRPMLAVERG
jgi:hypothetical protein